ncbi:hypothetical protein [Clostridium saccharoperbutylacetonicum]|uniref:hypothetical protein n=1 Tax=Clostridium saccharoperbutylacetonicum TaxID=36745 RepID=UPI0039E997A5
MNVGDAIFFRNKDEEKITPGIIIMVNELEIKIMYVDFSQPHIIKENVNKPLPYKEKIYVNRQKDISILDIKNGLVEIFEINSISPVTA